MIDITKCPLCGRPNEENVVAIHAIQYYQCQDCELYYQTIYMSPDELKEFYITDYSYNVGKGRKRIGDQNKPSVLSEERYNLKFNRCLRRGMDTIINEMPCPSKIFEIGADAGGCSIYAKSKGHNIEAVEMLDEHAKRIEVHGIKVYRDLFESIDFGDKKFNYIIALEVLEHIVNPMSFINKVYNLLGPNGYFVIETPIAKAGLGNNTECYGFQFAHPCVFTQYTLPILFKEFSFIPEFDTGNAKVYMIRR